MGCCPGVVRVFMLAVLVLAAMHSTRQQQVPAAAEARASVALVHDHVGRGGLTASLNVSHETVVPQGKLDVVHWLSAAARALPRQSSLCDALFGEAFLTAWARQRLTVCAAGAEAAPQPEALSPDGFNPGLSSQESSNDGRVTSSIVCYPNTLREVQHALPHATVAHSFCVSRNTVVHSAAWLGSPEDGAGAKRGARHAPSPRPAPNSVQAACKLSDEDRNSMFQYDSVTSKTEANWLLQGTQDEAYDAVREGCSGAHANVVEHPVLFLTRGDGGGRNLYHHMEDLVTLFATLAILDLPAIRQHGLQVVVADHWPFHTHMETLQRMSHPHPVRILRTHPFPPGTCFRLAMYNAFAHGMSMLRYEWALGKVQQCQSSVLQGTMLWLKALYQEMLPMHTEGEAAVGSASLSVRAAQQSSSHSPGHPLSTVLYVSRRNFEQENYRRLREWQRQRCCIANEDALQVKLLELVQGWNQASCGRQAGIADVHSVPPSCRGDRALFNLAVGDFWNIPYYPDQLGAAMRTTIMIGVHGAGLSHMVWMPAGNCTVIEMRHNIGPRGAHHYKLLAMLLGHKYVAIYSNGNTINITHIATQVKLAMKRLGDFHHVQQRLTASIKLKAGHI